MVAKEKYCVLARKYRPQGFKDLIGQDALVRTISNAIAKNQLAQAYILTGIRGVGKTSSARIIARAFNCIGEDGKGGMTPNPCGKCKHCLDIANDCHVDVIEIDAASNTKVENIREVIEGARYNPISARYKVYIIDEVHMLSKSAFNALLKILEEPPERVKFIFATTEIRSVPVTILSRCQRFDLKRIETPVLATYFKEICHKENVAFDDASLLLIAKAADGSVRDGLSLLDQAIAHGDGEISEDKVREMLGLADSESIFKLYEQLMKGDLKSVLQSAKNQYNKGTDPLTLTSDLMDLTHKLTEIKIIPDLLQNDFLSDNEKKLCQNLADNLSISTLTRTWQMLIKGFNEIKFSEVPFQALEMLFVRIAYASDLPTPLELAQQAAKETTNTPSAQKKTSETVVTQVSVVPSNSPKGKGNAENTDNPKIHSLEEIVKEAQDKGKILLAFQISNYFHPIVMTYGKIHFSAPADMPKNLPQDVQKFLLELTGIRWEVVQESGKGGLSIKEKEQNKEEQIKKHLKETPLVSSILKTFPNSKIDGFHLTEPNHENSVDESHSLLSENEDNSFSD